MFAIMTRVGPQFQFPQQISDHIIVPIYEIAFLTETHIALK